MENKNLFMVWKLAILFLLGTVLSGCASSLSSIVKQLPFLSSLTEQDEVRIGREFRRHAKKQLKLIHHPEIRGFVERVSRRILSAMEPQLFDYRFFVVEDSQLNAFAIPGGSIYVHTGLIDRAKSTDELASVLGHEIVHVKARHIARMSQPDPASFLALLGTFLVAAGSQGPAAAALGHAVGYQSTALFYPKAGAGGGYPRRSVYGRSGL